jgi:hypothetical protein
MAFKCRTLKVKPFLKQIISENFSHLRNCALMLGKHFSSLRRIVVRLSSELISPVQILQIIQIRCLQPTVLNSVSCYTFIPQLYELFRFLYKRFICIIICLRADRSFIGVLPAVFV